MVFAKGNPGIAALYDKLLVSEELQPLGEKLRANYEETQNLLLQVCCPVQKIHFLHFVQLPF
jgi:phosphoenolpyruvate carboxylase